MRGTARRRAWVVDRVLPQQADRGENNLGGEAFLVEELHARVHALPVGAVWQLSIKVAQVVPRLFLTISNYRTQQFFDVEQLQRFVVDDQPVFAGDGIFVHFVGAGAILRIDVPLEKVERFHEMAVGIDGEHGVFLHI